MKKKLVLGAAVVALGALLAVGGTLAWFTDTETAANVITTGNVNIRLTEAEPGTPAGGNVSPNGAGGYTYTGIVPGSVLDKKPEVALETNSNDAWVRVEVEVTTIPTGLNLEGMVYKMGDKEVKPEIVDGKAYFYCPSVLTLKGENASTYVPFDKVEFPGDAFGNEFANSQININLKAEAIQSDNLNAANAEAAFKDQEIESLEPTAAAETTAPVETTEPTTVVGV